MNKDNESLLERMITDVLERNEKGEKVEKILLGLSVHDENVIKEANDFKRKLDIKKETLMDTIMKELNFYLGDRTWKLGKHYRNRNLPIHDYSIEIFKLLEKSNWGCVNWYFKIDDTTTWSFDIEDDGTFAYLDIKKSDGSGTSYDLECGTENFKRVVRNLLASKSAFWFEPERF